MSRVTQAEWFAARDKVKAKAAKAMKSEAEKAVETRDKALGISSEKVAGAEAVKKESK